MDDLLRLEIAVCAWAEARSIRGGANRSTASFVAEILTYRGFSGAMAMCDRALRHCGWRSVRDDPPKTDGPVLTCEDLGDSPRLLRFVGGEWRGPRGEPVFYTPSWWKERR